MKNLTLNPMPNLSTPQRQLLLRLLRPHFLLLLILLVTAGALVVVEGAGLGVIMLILGAGDGNSMVQSAPFVAESLRAIQESSVSARIRYAALILLAITVIRSGLMFLQQVMSNRMRIDFERSLQREVLHNFHLMPFARIQERSSAEWATLVGHYSRQVGQLAGTGALALAGIVLITGYFVIALVISWQLTLVAIAPLALVSFILRPLLLGRLKAAHRRFLDELKSMYAMANEHIRATKLIRLYNRTEWSDAQFAARQEAYFAHDFHASVLQSLNRPLYALFSIVGLTLLLVGASFFLRGSDEAQLGQVALFIIIAMRLVDPLSMLSGFRAQLSQAAPMLDTILELFETSDQARLPDGTRPFHSLESAIEFRDVTFAYNVGMEPALFAIDLHIPKNRLTALVGPSGAGKSTIVNLLARLYDPDAGQIFVDGVDLRALKLTSWRRKLAVVSQDLTLFQLSIRENLRFSRPDADDHAIVRAARAARAHEFITALPDGYDTVLYEQGANLSGGQRQRLALARALLAEPDILILDEAVSELDTVTERAVRGTINQYRHDHTVLVIAHRLETIQMADTIYVIERGRVVQRGAHAELSLRDGVYRQLIEA